MKRLFDTLQFLELAKITRPTMMVWQERGLIPTRRIGNAFYFLQEDIDKVPKIKEQMKKLMGQAGKKRK